MEQTRKAEGAKNIRTVDIRVIWWSDTNIRRDTHFGKAKRSSLVMRYTMNEARMDSDGALIAV
jgi:hypothetical protein